MNPAPRRCPVCGSRNSCRHCLHADIEFVRCLGCRCIFQAAPPDEAKLADIYRGDYHIRRGHAGDAHIESLKTATTHSYLRTIESLSPPGRRLVEVGCSAGAALAAAVERGWKVEGIEPSPEAAEVARRRPGVRAVHTGSLLDAAIPPNSVDVMLFFDVIEHIDPPEPTLRAVHRCLSPGGLVLMVTPDAGSLSARWMGRRWPHLFVEHVVIYGRAALAQALEQVGLTVERVAFAWKRVNLNMLVRHATIHRHVRFGALLRVLGHLVPRPLQNLTFPFNMGEFYIIARRGEPRAAGRDTERPA